MTLHSRSVCVVSIILLLTSGCATLTTTAHFTRDSPMVYSGTRLDIHASANHDAIIRSYKDRYGIDPPDHPTLDLPFSLLFDTIILVPVVLPIVLYQAVFD